MAEDRLIAHGSLSFEEWRHIPNHSGYMVSNMGRVISFLRRAKTRGAQYYVSNEPAFLRLHPDTSGHLKASLRGKTHLVHVLVLNAFVGPKPDGLECRHLDDNKAHNHLTNLKWDTRSRNMLDRIINGILVPRLSDGDILTIKDRLAVGHSQRSIAKDFGVCQQMISRVNIGLRQAHSVIVIAGIILLLFLISLAGGGGLGR